MTEPAALTDSGLERTRGKRIAIAGPVLPFRGGIAQHTTMLARALSNEHDCQTISFTRLYPQRLFPGESDRDPDYAGHLEPNTEYLLDSINPITWITTIGRIKKFRPDFVFIPWWTFFLGPVFGFLAWRLRKNGIEVVFFCHNVIDHEQAAWKRWLTKAVMKQGSRFVVHTKVEADGLQDLIPGARVAVHPHPIYDQFPQATRHLPRRAGLELLFYGFVRPYKGLDILIEAMGLLKGEDIFLTVAGEFWEGEKQTLARIAELQIQNQVEIRPRYHSDEETAELFDRADVVVLPYLSATGSGVIPIAYHYRKPVIATRVGGLPDVVVEGKTGWLATPDPGKLAHMIRNVDIETLPPMKEHIARMVNKLSWNNLSETCLSGRSLK